MVMDENTQGGRTVRRKESLGLSLEDCQHSMAKCRMSLPKGLRSLRQQESPGECDVMEASNMGVSKRRENSAKCCLKVK